MIWFLKTFWKSLSFFAGLIGLLFLAADVSDIPDAVAGWRRVFAVIEPITALSIFSAFALAYIVWIDARPLVDKHRTSERYPVAVHKEVAWISIPFEANGDRYYKNVCYLVIHNHGRKQKTARDVRVQTFTVGDPFVALTKDGASSIDIHHGEVGWFELGYILANQAYGWVNMTEGHISSRDIDQALKGVANGSYTFNRGEKSGIGLHYRGLREDDYSDNPMSFFTARVSASDLPNHEVKFRLLRDRLEREGSDLISPIEIISVTVL